MKSQLRSILIITAGIYISTRIIDGFKIAFDWQTFAIVAGIIFVVHSLVGPIAKALLIPFSFVSSHIIDILVISATLYGLTFFIPQISINAYQFQGLATANFVIPPVYMNKPMVIVAAAVVIGLTQFVLNWLSD
ncbi:MAG TPA: hypothetical protein VIK81_00715 [Patescibacteria group bacterium]